MAKRGASDLVSNGVVIAIAIVLAIIIVVAGIVLIAKQYDEQLVATPKTKEIFDLTTSTSFKIISVNILSDRIDIQLKNTGSSPIYQFSLKLYSETTTKSIPLKLFLDIDNTLTFSIPDSFIDSSLEKIEIIPGILVNDNIIYLEDSLEEHEFGEEVPSVEPPSVECEFDSDCIQGEECFNNLCVSEEELNMTECNDGIDNDGDGSIDLIDLGCENVFDNDETDTAIPECSDGIDNDADGFTDANDPNCESPDGLSESGLLVLNIDQNNPNCDDSNSRIEALNPNTPWCSLRALHDGVSTGNIESGDTVSIKAGDYSGNEHINIQGTSAAQPLNGLTLKAFPGDNVIIRGQTVDPAIAAWRSDPLLNFQFINDLTIDSLNFVGYEEDGAGRIYVSWFIGMSDISTLKIIDSSFFDFQGNDDLLFDQRYKEPSRPDISRGVLILNSDNILVDNVKFRCTDSPSHMVADQQSVNGLDLRDVDNALIENSEFLGCTHISLSLIRTKNTVIQKNKFSNEFHTSLGLTWSENNIIKENSFNDWNLFPSESSNIGYALEILHSSNNKVYNNLFYNGFNRAIGIGILASSGERTENNEIYHNLIYSSGQIGIWIANFPTDEYVLFNNKIHNNIFYGLTHPSPRGAIRLYYKDFASNENGNEVTNNIMANFDGNQNVISNNDVSTGAVQDLTVEEAEALFDTFGGNTNSNPLLVNPANEDFHLQSSSPAIDNTDCISYITKDFDGNSRPSADCDIGPFEY